VGSDADRATGYDLACARGFQPRGPALDRKATRDRGGSRCGTGGICARPPDVDEPAGPPRGSDSHVQPVDVDSVPAFALLLALFFGVSRRYPLAWLALAIAVFVKPQPVVVAPLLLVWQIRDQGWSARLLVSLAVGFAVAYAGSLPFARSAAPVATISWLLNRYRDATQLYPFTSVSAFNLYTVRGGFFESDARVIGGLSVAAWGIVLFTVLLAIVLVAFRRALYDGRPLRAYEPLFFTAVFATLSALFVVTTRMHERYLFGALVLTPLLILVGRWERSVAIVLTTTFTIDCVLVLSRLTVEPYPRGLSAVIHVLSLLNVAALAVLIVRLAATRSPARALPNCS
jgi:dolichyl-phosphate-mannose-protein mannosyltransferase